MMSDMFTTSPETGILSKLLSKAQGEIEGAIKDKKNPAFRSNYASFDSVLEACRPALVRAGICVTQWPVHTEDSRVHIITRVSHEGQWMQSQFSIPVDKQNAHGYGSALTYLKRFCYSAAIGVSTDIDDDGNAAIPHGVPVPPKPPQLPGFDPMNKAHTDKLAAECLKRKIFGDHQKNLLAAMKGKSFTELEAVIKATNPESSGDL